MIISAPSGSGKTTLCNNLTRSLKGIARSVSCTTRQPRPGERRGRDYHFITKKDFLEKKRRDYFIEWARYFGNFYGTPKRHIIKTVRNGRDVLLSIDVQGQAKIKKVFPESVSIFIMPPSLLELKKRLNKRRTDSISQIQRRLQIAKKEMSLVKRYDYIVVNDDLKKATDLIRAIMVAEKCRNN